MARWGSQVLFVAVAVMVGGFTSPATAATMPAPAPGAWSAAPAPPSSSSELPPFALPDGGALSLGTKSSSGVAVFVTQRWSEATRSWSLAANPSIPREYAGAAQLGDGRIMLIGGGRLDDGRYDYSDVTEIFDPATGTWSGGPTLSQARLFASATTLPDGTVMVAGGYVQQSPAVAEILDLAAGTSTVIAPPADRLGPGYIGVIGNGRFVFATTGPNGHLYNIAAGTWAPVPGPASHSSSVSSVVLSDGRLLSINGDYFAPRSRRVEIFDPDSRVWSYGPPTLANRSGGYAVLLSGGRLLAVSAPSGELTAETLDVGNLAAGWSPVAVPEGITPGYGAARLVALKGGAAMLASFGEPRGTSIFDPSVPAAPFAYSLTSTPTSFSGNVGASARFTLTLKESTTKVEFENVALLGGVMSGPNQGSGYCVMNWSETTPCVTPATGKLDFVLPGAGGPGTDTLEFTGDVDGDGVADEGEPEVTMTAVWNRVSTQLGAVAHIDPDQDRNLTTVDPTLGQMRARLTRLVSGDYGSYKVAIASRRIRFTVGTRTACSATTGADGWATCAAPPALTEVAVANGYNAFFDGDLAYTASRSFGPIVKV